MADGFQQGDPGTWLGSDDVGGGIEIPRIKLTFGQDGTATDVAADNPLPVSLSGSGAVLVAGWNGAARDVTNYDSANIDFTGISGGDSWVIQGSNTNGNFKTLTAIRHDLTTVASVVADGVYSVPAYGFLRLVKTGTASTPTINLLLKG